MMPTPIARTALILPFIISLSTATVHADEVTDKAEAGLAELRFDDALRIASEGLEDGTRGPDELVTLYMILGKVSASMGEEEEAERYFQAALSIDREASLPEGVSPKLSEPFATAKSLIGDADPIGLLSELEDSGQLSVQITSDPAKLVRGIVANFESAGNEESLRAEGNGTLRLEIPRDATNLQVALVDEYGNRLVPLVDVDSPLTEVVKKSSPTVRATTSSPPIHRRWQLYAGLAVGSLATGAYFGYASRSKTNEIACLENGTEFSVAQALEDDARSSALLANIGFAVSLGLGAAAFWMYKNEETTTESNRTTAIVPMLGAGRTGLAASVRF